MNESQYTVSNEGSIQGQVVGSGNTIIQNFPNAGTPPHHVPASKPIWNVPYRRNPYFTGREQVLEELHQRLMATQATALSQTQAISGLGGIGKTQIAIEYAYRHRKEYLYVLWINGATRENIIASFLELEVLLDLPHQQEPDQNKIIADVKKWFTTHNQWLVIFDNADDLSLIEEFIPINDAGHFLLTTRDQAPGTLANSLPIEVMNKHEGTLLLLRRAKLLITDVPLEKAKRAYRTQAERIVNVMDGLPLALVQAAAYIEETGCSLDAYLKQFQRNQEDFLGRRGKTGKDHPLPVVTTWSLSFTQVQQLNPLAADLLRVCAFLAPDNIPEEIMIKGASKFGPLLAKVSDDTSLLDEAIGVLRRFSLVYRNRDEHTLSIHRLVQAVLQMDMDERTKKTWAERTVRAVALMFPDIEYETWLDCERLLPHALICVKHIERYMLESLSAAHLFNQTGSYLAIHYLYTEAEPLLQQAIAICEQKLGFEHPYTGNCINNLALLYESQGKYTEAEPLYQSALTICEQSVGPEHPNTATCLSNLASNYQNQGKYAEAEPLLQRALALKERELGPEHPSTATTLDCLALLYKVQGKYEEAGPLYQRALAIFEKVLGPEHPDTATCLSNLAGLYSDQEKYEEAQLLYERALAFREQVLGPEHPDTAHCLNNLSNLYYKQRKYTEAELLLQRVIAINELIMGLEHPDTVTSHNNLAVLYAIQGKYEEAESLFQRSLAINERLFGPNHPSIANILNNLGSLYFDQQKYADTEPLLRRALAIYEQSFGVEHPMTQLLRENYILLHRRMQIEKEAT